MRHLEPVRHLRAFICLLYSGIIILAGNLALAGERPNVILIMTDDQGYGDFGFTGNPILQTPNLDSMAGRSASMAQFYVSPVCAPTRAALMTGRFNYRTRAIDTWNGHAMMDPGETTIAEILQESGYATGLFGKWHLGDNYPLRPQDQGFQEVLMHLGGGIGQPSDPEGAEGKYTDPVLYHNGEPRAMKGFCTDVYFQHAISWIDGVKQDQPFFAYIATNAPHGPFEDVPEELYQKYKKMDLRNVRFPQEVGNPLRKTENLDQRARIFAMITNIDDNIGKLFEYLEDKELIENTLVIFLVDNGPIGGRYVAGLRGGKSEVYEGGIRSPILFHWPEKLTPGVKSDRISAHIDIPPTILDACGIESDATANMDGRSIWPLLNQEDVEWPDRSIVIQAHRAHEPKLFHNFAIRNQRWKLVHASGTDIRSFEGQPKFELYDMVKDPYETKNLASKHPDVVESMKADYIRWFADVSNTRPDNYKSPRIHIDPGHENPVILSRQDGEHFTDQPFGRGSIGVWRLKVTKPGSYSIHYRFAEIADPGKAILSMNGRELSIPVAKGATEATFEDVSLEKGKIDLMPMLSIDNHLFSPWKIDISK